MAYCPMPKEKKLRDSLHCDMPSGPAGCASGSRLMLATVDRLKGRPRLPEGVRMADAHLCWVDFTADDPTPKNQEALPTRWLFAQAVWQIPPHKEAMFKTPRTCVKWRVLAGSEEFTELLAALRWEEGAGNPRLRLLLPIPLVLAESP
jgi:hypothetical protein